MWQYHKQGGWSTINKDFMQEADDDVEKGYLKCGFSSEASVSYGDVESFGIEVRARTGLGEASKLVQKPNTLPSQKDMVPLNHNFVVSVWIGGRSHDVVVKDLPDLIHLLGQLVPLATTKDPPA